MIPRATRRRAPGHRLAGLERRVRLGLLGGIEHATDAAGGDGRDRGVGTRVRDHGQPAVGTGHGERDVAVAHVGDELEVGRDVVEVRLRRASSSSRLGAWMPYTQYTHDLGYNLPSISPVPGWRNRQTRRSQKPVLETECGFDPRPGHHRRLIDRCPCRIRRAAPLAPRILLLGKNSYGRVTARPIELLGGETG